MGMMFRQSTSGFIGEGMGSKEIKMVCQEDNSGITWRMEQRPQNCGGDKCKCGGKERLTTDQERCQEHPEENLAKRQCEGRVKTLGTVYG